MSHNDEDDKDAMGFLFGLVGLVALCTGAVVVLGILLIRFL